MICPKCGHKTQKEQKECPRCGIVFAKFHPNRAGTAGNVVFQSKILAPRTGTWEQLLSPLAAAKKYTEAIFARLLNLIWDELISDESPLSFQSNLIAALVFCAFSMAFYYLDDYTGLIILFLLLLWGVDYVLAERRYRKKPAFDTVQLRKLDNDKFSWHRVHRDKSDALRFDFAPWEIKRITLSPHEHEAGAFNEVMGIVWRIELLFKNDTRLPLSEKPDITVATQEAKALAEHLRIPLEFLSAKYASDYGYGNFAVKTERFYKNPREGKPFEVHRRDGGVRIGSRFSINQLWPLFLSVVHESGFLIFVLTMTALMVRLGMILHHALWPALGFDVSPLSPAIAIDSFKSVLSPDWGVVELGEIILALGLMLYEGIGRLRRWHIDISVSEIRYIHGRKKIDTIETGQVESLLYFEAPYFRIMILGDSEAIEIGNLKNEYEYRALWNRLDLEIKRYKKNSCET